MGERKRKTAKEIASGFRRLHFFNIALAGSLGKSGDGALREACDMAEEALAKALEDYARALSPPGER